MRHLRVAFQGGTDADQQEYLQAEIMHLIEQAAQSCLVRERAVERRLSAGQVLKPQPVEPVRPVVL
jgi:hypothetical protein